MDTAKTLDQQRQHNAANEITDISRTVGSAWATPTYDRNGNMLSDEKGQQYIYDAWNRLVTVKDTEGASLAVYAYDGLGWRINDDDGTAVTELYYSNAWQVLEEQVDGKTMMQYVYSPGYVDELVLRDRAMTAPGTLDERLWVLQDANYNVVSLVDVTGVVVERYSYDPFGAVTVYTDAYSVRSGGSLYAWNVLWQGRPYDSVSGTYNFREREVSPTLGRPITGDPLGLAPDTNWYRWEGNGPTNRLDPSGLWSWKGFWAGVGIGGTAAGTAGAVGGTYVNLGAGTLIGGVGGGLGGGIVGGVAGGIMFPEELPTSKRFMFLEVYYPTTCTLPINNKVVMEIRRIFNNALAQSGISPPPKLQLSFIPRKPADFTALVPGQANNNTMTIRVKLDCSLPQTTKDIHGQAAGWGVNCRPDAINTFAQENGLDKDLVWATTIAHEIGYHILAGSDGGNITNNGHRHATGFVDARNPARNGRENFSPETTAAILRTLGLR